MPHQTCKNLTADYIKVIVHPVTVFNIKSINIHKQYLIKPEGVQLNIVIDLFPKVR